MENEIERKFYKQLDAKVKTKSKKQKKSTIHFSMVKSTSHLLKRYSDWKEESVKKNQKIINWYSATMLFKLETH